MTAKTELSAPKRRTRAEVQQLVADFVSSGMRRSEFCQSRGLSFSTLDRHLKKLRWKRRRKPISSAGCLVPVELAARKSPKQHEPSCGLARRHRGRSAGLSSTTRSNRSRIGEVPQRAGSDFRAAVQRRSRVRSLGSKFGKRQLPHGYVTPVIFCRAVWCDK